MTISYKWLSEYLPEEINPQKLSNILTSIGLEVENLEKFELIKGGLDGIVAGEVLACYPHPNADKLKVTSVNVGEEVSLKIVCGAANVAAGQKVLVAMPGTTIYPTKGGEITIKAARIRGEESQGMICAEDEIGLGTSHEGILVLPGEVKTGTKAAGYFKPYTDFIYEIGLTPNRMDAMSHIGVAKDVCAYLSYHNQKDAKPKSPFPQSFKADNNALPIKVTVENTEDCRRYSGLTLSGVTVKESPKWLRDKLLAIGQRPINNIVDITNFILHETGQPLHAFDANAITGGQIIVKNIQQGEPFVTLDEKERKIDKSDLMICNAVTPMCIAGVFGGAKSGVKPGTKSIFLESAWFNPVTIRKTSFRHNLRTEAAARFEKGIDISNVVNVLQRAALLIKEVAGGEISSDVTDVYPSPQQKTKVEITYNYLKKLSGKYYQPQDVTTILMALGFEVLKQSEDKLCVSVPFSKTDISLPADIVEEILRIDGLDNVAIPGSVTLTPSADPNIVKETLRDKTAGFLTGLGFNEIVTNSITNSKFYIEEELSGAVKMINSLSADLDMMRPSMVESGLEAISYNINRKNKDLQFFEFGKTYTSASIGEYTENEHLSLYLTGESKQASWNSKQAYNDIYRAKGIALAVVKLCGIAELRFSAASARAFAVSLTGLSFNRPVVSIGQVSEEKLKIFGIKQPVFFISFNWLDLVAISEKRKIIYKEVSRFPTVERDLAVVVNKAVRFEALENAVEKLKIPTLQQVQLFDIFESEKLGTDKKSMAVSFTFADKEKTLADKEIDGIMNKLVKTFETGLNAEIRK